MTLVDFPVTQDLSLHGVYPRTFPTDEEIEVAIGEARRKVKAALEERLRDGWIREPSIAQQGEKDSTGKQVEQLAKEQFVDDKIIHGTPNGSVADNDTEQWTEEEMPFTPLSSEEEMIQLLDWFESEYREDLPGEHKGEIFIQLIERINRNQPDKYFDFGKLDGDA